MQIVPVPHEKLLRVFPFAIHALGRDLSLVFLYSSYRHLGVQVLKRCVPVASANLYHQRAQGAVSLWREEECGCAPAPLLCLLCTFCVAVFEETETLAVFLTSPFTLLEAPEPLLAILYFFICFNNMDVL